MIYIIELVNPVLASRLAVVVADPNWRGLSAFEFEELPFGNFL
jgi:hypothetical protein